MGFAQKLGEFTEGFAGGLLPGLKAGATIGAARSARAVATKREQRLANANERSMIYSMAKESPSDAIRLANSLGLTNIATAIRSGSQEEARKSIAAAGGALPTGPISMPTDLTKAGRGAYTTGLASRLEQRKRGIAGLQTSIAGIPEGIMSPEAMGGVNEYLGEEIIKGESLQRHIDATSRFFAEVQDLRYMDPDFEVNLGEIANTYMEVTKADPSVARDWKRSITRIAQDNQYETWKGVVTTLDHEALLRFNRENPSVPTNPRLAELVQALLEQRLRESEKEPLSPEERARIKVLQDQVKLAQTTAEALAMTGDIPGALDAYKGVIDGNRELGWSREALASLQRQAPKLMESYTFKMVNEVREFIIKKMMDPFSRRMLEDMTGITLPSRETAIDDPVTIRIIGAMTDKFMRAQNPPPPEEDSGKVEAPDNISVSSGSDKDKIVSGLLEMLDRNLLGEAAEIWNTGYFSENDKAYVEAKLRSSGWMWNAAAGKFEYREVYGPPALTPQDTTTAAQATTTAAPVDTSAFLGGAPTRVAPTQGTPGGNNGR